jgi:uncharacterized membrane protein YgaE (UPF0421/DUF939 family)
MGKYSKLLGTIIGAILGVLAALGFNVEVFTPEVQAAIVTVFAAGGTYLAPGNKAD